MQVGYLCQPNGEPHTAETFDWREYMRERVADTGVPLSELLSSSHGRKLLTRLDPLAHALVYLRHHLRGRETGDEVTFCDAHLDWARQARDWIRPVLEPRDQRRAKFAPRATGKTTWHFLILPTWAAAHGWKWFVAAFADTATQAEEHLKSFRRELENNVLLREDYPELCYPSRKSNGAPDADNTTMYRAKKGFVFAARGADTSSLGLKVDERRPDLLIFDDIEPPEAKYGVSQIKDRLGTITDAILPLNEYANVEWVGTTTIHGGLAHQLVRRANGEPLEDGEEDWIGDERFEAMRWPAILLNDDGTERSLWPAKWSMDFLNSIRHTRAYSKNYDNEPVTISSLYWSDADFTYITDDEWESWGATRTLLMVDPAVTDGKDSDWSALCVASWRPPIPKERPAQVCIRHVSQVKLTGRPLRDHCYRVAQRFPELRRWVVECNQGGLTWLDTMSGVPYEIDLIQPGEPKHIRAADALLHYQQRPTRVVHHGKHVLAEGQMKAFPLAAFDDMVDVVSHATNYFLSPDKIQRPKNFQLRPPKVSVQVSSYR